ncbi:MAG: radical SAM protein [bacterium]|nr:radical SAM protein [bacterium]
MCNLNCVHCYMVRKSSKCMDVERAKNILEEARALGVEVVDLTGGEPSLHPRFSTIVGYALSLGLKQLNICTNGYALDTSAFRNFDLANIHCFISMDGASEEVVRKIRGGDIDKLTELFKELKRIKLRFSLRFCLNVQNWMETAEMLAFAGKLEVDAAFEPTQIVGKAGESLVLSREQMLHVSSVIRNFPKTDITIEESFTAPFPCDGGQSDLLSVDTDGIGTVCLMVGANRQILPDNPSLKEMWDALQVYKERMKNFRPTMERCTECPHLPLCLSGCHVTACNKQCFNPWKGGNWPCRPIELL